MYIWEKKQPRQKYPVKNPSQIIDGRSENQHIIFKGIKLNEAFKNYYAALYNLN